MRLTLGSLFDGIGGWQLAAERAGVLPLWSSEIAPVPRAVTQYRFPATKQLGDVRQIDGARIAPVDIVCAGSPCQDLSVANKDRRGLKGERSGLFRCAVDVIREMRKSTGGRHPRFFLWENVPGAFYSNRGMDFKSVLESLLEAEVPMPPSGRWAAAGMVRGGGREIAWRILDAQYWGVPQRRKRIFLVCDFGGDSAGEILFERESVRGDSAKVGSPQEWGPAGTTESAGAAVLYVGNGQRKQVISDKVAGTLTCAHQQAAAMVRAADCRNLRGTGVSGTLRAKEACGYSLNYQNPVRVSGVVRRLTPMECERLQGLPDGWTQVPGVRCSDTARYKAIGNGMAQPCADFILSRIAAVVKDSLITDCAREGEA